MAKVRCDCAECGFKGAEFCGFRKLQDERAALRKIADALALSQGIRNCQEHGCASCAHSVGCDSRAVVEALNAYETTYKKRTNPAQD